MSNFKILLVDDIEVNNYSIELIIEENFDDIEVHSVMSASEALDFLEHDSVDLIFSDVQMPEVDGIELLKILSNNEKTKNIPFVLITCNNNKDVLKEANQYGVSDYILKPIDVEKICSTLEFYINQKSTRKENLKDEIYKVIDF